MAPPLLLLGVRRSGTTLLRVMLDRNSTLAIPDESYFIPQLASRQRGRLDVDEFVDDLRRLPTIRDWEVPVEDVRVRIGWRGATLGDAIGAVYEVYAARRERPAGATRRRSTCSISGCSTACSRRRRTLT